MRRRVFEGQKVVEHGSKHGKINYLPMRVYAMPGTDTLPSGDICTRMCYAMRGPEHGVWRYRPTGALCNARY